MKTLLFAVLTLLTIPGSGMSADISNIQLSPPSPSTLGSNENIQITFDYYSAVFGDWGWKLATDINDAHNFLNGLEGYDHPVQDARVTAVWTGTQTHFHIFYKSGTQGQVFGSWGWKLASQWRIEGRSSNARVLDGSARQCYVPCRYRI